MSRTSQVPWPELPTAAWRETYETLHLWTQIVGKIRLVRSPWLNHSWNVALYVTARGLTTSPIQDDSRSFQIDFDFIDHALRISTSDGAARQLALAGQSVASFYAAVMAALAELGIHLVIDEMPNELPEPIRFSQDHRHASYDPAAVRRFFQMLFNADRVFKRFRTGFLPKGRPEAQFFGEAVGEFILPYDALRTAAAPDQVLLAFLQSTYEAAANAAKWHRDALECELGQPGVVRKI